MFTPLTTEIEFLAKRYKHQVAELEGIFDCTSNLYLDYANLKNWSDRLKWELDMARLYALLRSFDTIADVKVYFGTIVGQESSEKRIEKMKAIGYTVITKPVKKIKLSIDVSSLPSKTAATILKNFVSPQLLRQLKVAHIEYLNAALAELNKQGITSIEHMKCNFDVEIGRDMQLDHLLNGIQGFCLWSGDSDFADPLAQLLQDKKKATLFATARKVAWELNELGSKGLFVYDIAKIKEFIAKR